MKFLRNDTAESPIEAAIVVMVTIMVMGIVTMTMGGFVDIVINFMNTINIPITHAVGTTIQTFIFRLVTLFYGLPIFVIVLMFVWMFKVIIKRHRYSTQTPLAEDY